MSDAPIRRIVALGASNLTRGFHAVVSSARSTWGPETEIIAALGNGRSYGADSRYLFARTLPGILESGLWRKLETLEPMPTRALVTDVGNDILYGFSAEQVLSWVGEALGRLGRHASDIVVTDLPMFNLRRLSPRTFAAFRSIQFPSSRVTFEHVASTARQINVGLEELAVRHGARLFHLDPEWYGLDPIHIRPLLWRSAWQTILGTGAGSNSTVAEALRLYFMRPERQWLFGVEQRKEQTGTTLAAGARIWLY